jgi:hypothetical protein
MTQNQPQQNKWHFDSSVASHMASDSTSLWHIFTQRYLVPSNIVLGDGSLLLVTSTGFAQLPSNLLLNNVLVSRLSCIATCGPRRPLRHPPYMLPSSRLFLHRSRCMLEIFVTSSSDVSMLLRLQHLLGYFTIGAPRRQPGGATSQRHRPCSKRCRSTAAQRSNFGVSYRQPAPHDDTCQVGLPSSDLVPYSAPLTDSQVFSGGSRRSQLASRYGRGSCCPPSEQDLGSRSSAIQN